MIPKDAGGSQPPLGMGNEAVILSKTQSICPVCHKPLQACYVAENDCIRFVKTCPQHGTFQTTVSERIEDYTKWVEHPVINIAPETALTAGDPADQSCPLHCGTCENHLQTACCVLIDLTDRCNQHCPYCFAKSEQDAGENGDVTLAEIEAKYDLLLALGEDRPFNIQLSGGEPTVRDDLPEIIKMAREKGFSYIQINSNGRRLALEENYAQILRDAGASVIFMQFDGTRDDIYATGRGEPLFEQKKKAIRNCEKAGLPVTLVPTVVEGVNTDNIGEMMDFLLEHVNVVKGIHFQPVSFFGRHPEMVEGGEGEDSFTHSGDFPGRVTMFGLLRQLESQRPDFKYEHYCPIATGHTLCCFYSTYIREPDGSVRCTLTDSQKESGIGCCDVLSVDEASACCCDGSSVSETNACCCDGSSVNEPSACCCDASPVDKAEVIRRDRDFVLNKWEVASPGQAKNLAKYNSSQEITELDDFLQYYRLNSFTVTGMAFQDIFNLDAQRVKRCRVQVLSKDNRLIPFCAYNSIYRPEPGE